MDNDQRLRGELVERLKDAIDDAKLAARFDRDWRSTRIAAHVERMRQYWMDLRLPDGIRLDYLKRKAGSAFHLETNANLAEELAHIALADRVHFSANSKEEVLETLASIVPELMISRGQEAQPVFWIALDGIDPYAHEPEASDPPSMYSLEIWGKNGCLSVLNAADVLEWLEFHAENWIRVLERNELDPIRYYHGLDDCFTIDVKTFSSDGGTVKKMAYLRLHDGGQTPQLVDDQRGTQQHHQTAATQCALKERRKRGRKSKLKQEDRVVLTRRWKNYSEWLSKQDPLPSMAERVRKYAKYTGEPYDEVKAELDLVRSHRLNK